MRRRNTLRFLTLLLILLLGAALFAGCGAGDAETICVLFTNDVHLAAEDNIGYAGLSAYKQQMEEEYDHVLLLDMGDAVQGSFYGTATRGAYAVELMNALGYDYCVPGNHEFDYGVSRLAELMALSEASYLNCNLIYTGEGENPLAALKPWAVTDCGDLRLGLVGVTTPLTVQVSKAETFREGDRVVFHFSDGAGGSLLAQAVQQSVDACREAGADVVILMSHLGDGEPYAPYSAQDVIRNTTGIDIVLDGHAHSVLPATTLQDKAGHSVLLTSAGTELQQIGRLLIEGDGTMQVELVEAVETGDEAVAARIAEKNAQLDQLMSRVVGHTDTALRFDNDQGNRVIRTREMPLGNFAADAYRYMGNGDIAVANGGSLRANIPAGDITYGAVRELVPYENLVVTIRTTGQEILDMLEFSVADASLDENAGDRGAFLQVSGLRFTVDTGIPSPVSMDEEKNFVAIDGPRRVGEVMVLADEKTGRYEPLDPGAAYTLSGTRFLILEGGDGYTMFLDNEAVWDVGMLDAEAIIGYLETFEQGDIGSRYSEAEGRIRLR